MKVKQSFTAVVIMSAMVPIVHAKEAANRFDFVGPLGLTFSPDIIVTESYNDNIWLQDDDSDLLTRSSWITSITPSITASARKKTDYISIHGAIDLGQYHSSHDDDYVNKMFDASLHKEFNRRNKLDLSIGYNYLYEKQGTGQSQGIDLIETRNDLNKFSEWIADTTYTYGSNTSKGRLEFDYGYYNKGYKNNRSTTQFHDYDSHTLGVTFYYRIMPKTSLLFEVNQKSYDYDNTAPGSVKLDSVENQYEVGVTWEATAKTNARAQIGQTRKDFDASSRKDGRFTSWEVGITWMLKKYSTIEFFTASRPMETDKGGNSIERKYYKITWNHAWSERLSTSLSGGYVDDEYQESIRNEDVTSYSFGVKYALVRGVRLGAEYKYSERDSNIPLSDYRNNLFLLSLVIGY